MKAKTMKHKEPTPAELASIARQREEGEPIACPAWLKLLGAAALVGAGLAAACSLSGCATFKQPPAELEVIHQKAKARIVYQNYAKRDFRWIPEGETGQGNCAVHAATVYVDALKAGLNPGDIVLCRLPDGTGHAYTPVGEWASDVRYKHLILKDDEDCK